jgi:hypothetical protein
MADFSRIVDLSTATRDFDNLVNSGSARRTLNCIDQTMSRPYNGEGLDEVIDWHVYRKENDSKIKFEHYSTWPELYTLSKHLWEVVEYSDRNLKESYIGFEIHTSRVGVFKEFEEDINRVIDKVTYKDDDGFLIFPVLDHFLCEGGDSVSLLIHPKTGEAKVEGRWVEEIKFSSLEDAFNYLKKERYYQ